MSRSSSTRGGVTKTCSRLGVRRHQLPPRSPNLNAFVERFQGTALHLHWRTAFRYRFYTSAEDIDPDLQAWLRFYNFERPHRGYRTKGRHPAEIFYADRPDLLQMKGWDLDEFNPAKCPALTKATSVHRRDVQGEVCPGPGHHQARRLPRVHSAPPPSASRQGGWVPG